MPVGQERRNTIYGFPGPLDNLPLPTLVVNAIPTTMDYGVPGQQWLATNTVPSVMYFMSHNEAGLYNWIILESGGGSGVFASLTVTPGPVSLTGTTTINTTGVATTSIGTTGGTSGIALAVGTGNFLLSGATNSAITLGTGLTTGTILIGAAAQSGTITLGSSSTTNILNLGTGTGATTVNVATGATNAKAVNIGTGAVANTITVGSSTTGNITNLSSPITALPGPVYVYTGAGVPSNGLALHVGDLYINTTAASPTTRMYIATAASTWTNVTCAA